MRGCRCRRDGVVRADGVGRRARMAAAGSARNPHRNRVRPCRRAHRRPQAHPLRRPDPRRNVSPHRRRSRSCPHARYSRCQRPRPSLAACGFRSGSIPRAIGLAQRADARTRLAHSDRRRREELPHRTGARSKIVRRIAGWPLARRATELPDVSAAESPRPRSPSPYSGAQRQRDCARRRCPTCPSIPGTLSSVPRASRGTLPCA